MSSGFTFYLCLWKYAGFRIEKDMGIRFVLGYFSIAFVFCDIECTIKKLLKLVLEEQIEKLYVKKWVNITDIIIKMKKFVTLKRSLLQTQIEKDSVKPWGK